MVQKRKHIEVTIIVPEEEERLRPEQEQDEDGDEDDEPQQKKAKEGADTTKIGPFIANFATFKPERHELERFSFEVYGAKDPEKRHTQPMFLVSKQEGANLIGTTKPPAQTAVDKATYAVGIYNRETQTLRLTEAAGGCVVRLEAQAAHATDAEVAGLPAASQRSQQRTLRPEDVAARRAQNRKLVEAFGSTRRKRQLKQREEGAVVVDRNADEARLELLMREVAARATAAGETRQEVMAKIGAARVVPLHNPAATAPHQAYRLSQMFPDTLMAALNVGQLLHAAEKAEDRQRLRDKDLVPAYVLGRLQRLTDSPDGKERKRRARTLALLSALLQLATARPMLKLLPPRPATEEGGRERPGGLEELSRRLKIGRKEVLEQLLDMFYSRSNENDAVVYSRDEQQRQLLLMHLLVAALDFEGWSLAAQQFEELRSDLKMTPADVVSRFRELGCICTSSRLQGGLAADGTPSSVSSYTVRLLPDGKKTLAESFPKPKTGPRQQKGK